MNELDLISSVAKRVRKLEKRPNSSPSRGTSFPSSVEVGTQFFRTDLGLQCYWDGTYWLTVQEYRADREIVSLTITGDLYISPLRSDYQIYVTRIIAGFLVTVSNDGTNYWSLEIKSFDTTYSSSTVLLSTDSSAHSVGVWYPYAEDPLVNVPVNQGRVLSSLTKVNSPGTVYIEVSLFYRLIVG